MNYRILFVVMLMISAGYRNASAMSLPTKQTTLTKQDVFPDRTTVTFGSRSAPTPAARDMVQNQPFSFTSVAGHRTLNLPSSNNLFPDHAGLQAKFDAFIKALSGADSDFTDATLKEMSKTVSPEELKKITAQQDTFKTFIPKFSRLHFLVLYELYMYLMKIYTNCNLCTTDDMNEFVKFESKTTGMFLNQKTMLINHLINLIEAQTNEFLRQKWPTFNKKIAGIGGVQLMRLESGADIGYMVRDLDDDFKVFDYIDVPTQTAMKQKQVTYLTVFGKYLSFFKEYTSDLLEDNPETGLNKFIDHAERIGKLIEDMHKQNSAALDSVKSASKILSQNIQSTGVPSPQTTDQTKIIADTVRKLPRINPPLFFYNDEVLRSLRLIPHIAKNIPATSAKIPWPKKYIEAAQRQTKIQTAGGNPFTIKGYESGIDLAEFFDANLNKVTNQQQARYLIVNIPTSSKIYQQQLLAQPDWMNSSRGIMNMLRACLGDFSALLADPDIVKEDILDPCTKHVIYQGAQKADSNALGIPAAVGSKAQQDCKEFVSMLSAGKGVPEISTQTGGEEEETGPGGDQ